MKLSRNGNVPKWALAQDLESMVTLISRRQESFGKCSKKMEKAGSKNLKR